MRFGFGLLLTGPHPPLPRFCSTKKSLSQALRASPKSPSSPTQVLFYQKTTKKPFPGSDSGLSLFFWGQELPFQGTRACFFWAKNHLFKGCSLFFLGQELPFERAWACFFGAKNHLLRGGEELVFWGQESPSQGGTAKAPE